jgi:hypothetical protein
MSPLKDTQPSTASRDATTREAVKGPPAASIFGNDADLENVPSVKQNNWTDIQRRAYHGSGIFDAPAVRRDKHSERALSGASHFTVETVALEADASRLDASHRVVVPQPDAGGYPIDPSHLAVPELRVACRLRGLNPGGGKDQLVERLEEAIRTDACAPLRGARDARVAAGVKRNAPEATTDGEATPPEERSLADPPHKNARTDTEKRRTVSAAKLRDLGVGTDVFAAKSEDVSIRRHRVSLAKAKEAAGHGAFLSANEPGDGNREVASSTRVVKLASRPTDVPDLHEQTHSVFAVSADPNQDARDPTRGGRLVSETLKRSLFEGSKIFDADEERRAGEAVAARLRSKDAEESRVIAHRHHEGHGIFSESWVVPRDIDDDEAIDGDVPIEATVVRANRSTEPGPEPGEGFDAEDGFKPIGQTSPMHIDLRWKTEAEEEAEERVAVLVYEAIRRVLDRASAEAFYAEK